MITYRKCSSPYAASFAAIFCSHHLLRCLEDSVHSAHLSQGFLQLPSKIATTCEVQKVLVVVVVVCLPQSFLGYSLTRCITELPCRIKQLAIRNGPKEQALSSMVHQTMYRAISLPFPPLSSLNSKIVDFKKTKLKTRGKKCFPA